MAYAKTMLMFHGHDPRTVDEYPWRDVVAFIEMLPDLKLQHAYGGLPDG